MTKENSDLKKILDDLKPSLIREAFLVELLLAYEKIDENLKKRLIILNTRFSMLDDKLDQVSETEKKILESLISEIKESSNHVINDLSNEIQKVIYPLIEEKESIKKIGKEVIKANEILNQTIANLEKKHLDFSSKNEGFNKLSKWFPALTIIIILSLMLNSILVYKIFF